jgi:hypothetical protein
MNGNTNTCKSRAHTMEAIEILHGILMDNSNYSPNQKCQVEEDERYAPLISSPSNYTQSYLLNEINEAL